MRNKRLGGLGKALGIGLVAGAAAFAAPRAEADVAYEVTTTITAIDDNSDGITDRYSMTRRYENDSIGGDDTDVKFYEVGVLGHKQRTEGNEYGLETLFFDDWAYSETSSDSVYTAPESGLLPISRNSYNEFTTYVDAEDVLGFEEKDSFVKCNLGTFSNTGSGGSLNLTNFEGTHSGAFNAVPEPATVGLLGLGTGLTLLGRRVKENHSKL